MSSSSRKKDISYFFTVISGLFALIILFTILNLMILKPQAVKDYQNPKVAQKVVRGTIFDRNGRILAMEVPYYSCAFLLNSLEDLSVAAQITSLYTNLSPGDILAKCSEYSTYCLVQRRLDDSEVEKFKQAINDAGLQDGILIEKNYGRTYPALFHAAQIIGFTNSANQGLEGIEKKFDEILSPVPEINEDITYGSDIYLTLDLDIQYLLDVACQEVADLHKPDYVVATVMDAKTGELLASTSYPWFNLNDYAAATDDQKQNKAFLNIYEPGSVYKIYSLLNCLQANQADFETPFECDGSFEFTMPNGQEVEIGCSSAHGTITPETMIKKSCNGAIASWALQTDDQTFYDFLTKLGFGKSEDIQLVNSAGILSDPSKWSGRSKATISFGQETAATALQMTTAATVFANEGTLLNPTIISKITDHEGNETLSFQVSENAKLADPQIIRRILNGMESAATEGGTAVKTAVSGISVAAKTGTAQVIGTNSVMASTLALVPSANPRYIIYLAAYNPTGNTIWGANIAGPAIASVIEGLASQGKLSSTDSRLLIIKDF